MTSPKTVPLKKPCEYCGCDLPVGIDKSTRRIRSFHFASCPKRPSVASTQADGISEDGVEPEDPNRVAFETACFAYYRDLKAKGWQHPDEGDLTAGSLFWREPTGRYGVHQIEAAWCGWQMCMRSADVAREHGYRLGYAAGRAETARSHGVGVTPRVCPGCGYRMDPMQLSQARLDHTCPNCGKHRISEFREAA